MLPEWVTKIYEAIASDGERAQKNCARLTHLLELRLDQDDDNLNFLAIARIVREARQAGVDPYLIAKAEYRLAEIAPEIKLFGVAGLCDGCTAVRELLLYNYIIPQATGAKDGGAPAPLPEEPSTPVGTFLGPLRPLVVSVREALAKCTGGRRRVDPYGGNPYAA